jgi:hypothetical protein
VIGDIPAATGVLLVAGWSAAGLVAVGGAAKLARPHAAARALSTAGLPAGTNTARAIGALMVLIGSGAILRPSAPTELALATCYLSLAAFVGFLLIRRPGSGSCGCAGARDLPPTTTHVVGNLVAAGVAVIAAFVPPPGPGWVLETFGWLALPFAIGVAVVAAMLVALVTEAPAAYRAYTRPTTHGVERDLDRHARADVALAGAGVGPGHPSLWPEASDA